MSAGARWSFARRIAAVLAAAAVACAGAAAIVAWLAVAPGDDDAAPAAAPPSADAAERGAYLARAGNCLACHTAAGGAAYAGGRPIETPFGTVVAPNITPDAATGIGHWSADDFRRAMHHGRSKDGRLLAPAFPYLSYTIVTRADTDAIFSHLRQMPPVRRANDEHRLRFPYRTQAALALWRALYFRPGTFAADASRSPAWNRGSYLVRGLGHCNACHAARNVLGATVGDVELGGGLIPMQDWYAPSLAAAGEAGLADWSVEDIMKLLQHGVARGASVLGPMAEVVFHGTQHLADADLRAIAEFLKTLPPHAPPPSKPDAADGATLQRGGAIYERDCATCHGLRGEGVPQVYPPLAGNRAVTLAVPNNVVKAILHGGFAPATAGNPRPFGMPPFGQQLDDASVAAVASYIRQSWGNAAPAVSAFQVLRLR